MNGRRIFRPRQGVAGGSGITEIVFQRGGSMDLTLVAQARAWRRGGTGTALPALLQTDGDLPGRRRRLAGR